MTPSKLIKRLRDETPIISVSLRSIRRIPVVSTRTTPKRCWRTTPRLAELQQRLYADGRWALLIVLQGMDAGRQGRRHQPRRDGPQPA